jgi:catalase
MWLFSNTAEAVQRVPDVIVERPLKLFDKVDPAYGKGVREAIKKLQG